MSKFVFLISSIFFLHCGGVESEQSYCEKRADYYFALCIININATPNYYGKTEWKSTTVQAYAQNYCLIDFLRKKRCVDKSSTEPRKTNR